MNSLPNIDALPPWHRFLKSTLIILIIALTLNWMYYVLFKTTIKTPIPKPFGPNFILVQTVIAVLLNGYIHYYQRNYRIKNTFGFVMTIIILLIANLILCAFTWDIRMMPSINEMKRLYGEAHVPDILVNLSAPLALTPCILGMLGIPAIVYRKRSEQEVSLVKSYRSTAVQFVKVHLIVSTLIILANILYYGIYLSFGKHMPTGGFTLNTMVEMNLVTTAVAVVLYLYITDNGRQGLAIYIILTVCLTISTFLAGLPHPNGQPVYDDSLWLNIPLSAFSLIGETVGIPLVLKKLEKARKVKQEKDGIWN